MKKIFYFLMMAVTAVTLGACSDDDSEGLTDVIYYPHLTITGDQFTLSPIGQAYNDAGCTATLNGEDYTANVKVSGLQSIDINTAGLYTVTYTATSPDGYTMSAQRTVAVCDPNITTDISGTYTTQPGTYRQTYNDDGSPKAQVAFAGFTSTFRYAAPGIFYCTDMLAGYYDQRAGYGKNYALYGYVQLLADGTLKALSGHVNGWGDSYDDFTDAKFDAETGTISYTITYAGMDFFVILN